MLEKEYKYYKDNKESLLKEHEGKFVVILDQKVLGSYDSREEALSKTKEDHEVGTFLIQFVSPGADEEIQRFTSRIYINR